MQRYKFPQIIYKQDDNGKIEKIGETSIINYKCLICRDFVREWDDTWDDVKKAEIKAEADAHHNSHIVPQELNV